MEMEVANLMITKNPEVVEKLLKTYSTNEEAREELITELLMPGKDSNGKKRDPFNMDINVNPEDFPSISREILEKYFNVLGYSLTETIDKDKNN